MCDDLQDNVGKHMDRLRWNLIHLLHMWIIKKYQFEITNSFAALENLFDREKINRAWENIK